MAGDLYPLATDVELAKFRDSDPQGRLTVKTEPARRVRPELYIRELWFQIASLLHDPPGVAHSL